MCLPFQACANTTESAAANDEFFSAVHKRIRTQALRAEQFYQEAEEYRQLAMQCARRGDRVGAAGNLKRERMATANYVVEWDQKLVLESALSTIRRAMSNNALALQLGQASNRLQLLQQQQPNVAEAMDVLRDHHQHVAMDARELAEPLATIIADDDDDAELDAFMAANLALPNAPVARPGAIHAARVAAKE